MPKVQTIVLAKKTLSVSDCCFMLSLCKYEDSLSYELVHWIRTEARLSSRLTLESAWWDLLWEIMGKRRVDLRLSMRRLPNPDDFPAESDLSLQTEKEKIRQSSLSFSLLKEEGGTEKDWRNLSFSLFSLCVSGPVKRMTRRPKLCLYCAVALFLPLWRWWITQTPASMVGINNSSDDYGSLRICWVLNIRSESSHTLRLTDTACVILLPSLFLANYTAFKRPDPDVNNALFGQPKPV